MSEFSAVNSLRQKAIKLLEQAVKGFRRLDPHRAIGEIVEGKLFG